MTYAYSLGLKYDKQTVGRLLGQKKVPEAGPDEDGKDPSTRVRDGVPVRRVKLILGLQDLFKEFGIILIIKWRVAAEPRRGKNRCQL